MGVHNIVVIGAGIVGASIAHHLSRANVNLTVIDALEGPGLGVSAASFGWITCAAGAPDLPEEVYQSRLQAIDDYERLDDEFGGQICAPSKGALVWGGNEAETLDWAQQHEARGSVVRLVNSAALAAMEPMIGDPPALAAHFPREKAVDVQDACALLTRSAYRANAQLIFGQKVFGLEVAGGRVKGVRLMDRTIAADHVVVAAGAQSPEILGEVMPDHSISMSPAALVSLRADVFGLTHIIDGDGLEIRSRRNGELIIASGVENGPEEQIKADLAQHMLAKVCRVFPAIINPRVTSVEIGRRPFLADGRPLVSSADGVEGLILAASHPGVILAPEIARRVVNIVIG